MKNTLLCLDLELHPEAFLDRLQNLSIDMISNHDILIVNTPSNFRTNKEIELDFKRISNLFNLSRPQLKIYNANSVGEGIVEFANKWNYDTIAMLTKTDNSLRNLISRNPLEDVIRTCRQNLYIEHTDTKVPFEKGYELDYDRPAIPQVGH